MPSLWLYERADGSVPSSTRGRNVGVIVGCVVGIAILVFVTRRLFGYARRSRRGERMTRSQHSERPRYPISAQFMRFCALRAQKKDHLLSTEELDAVAPLTTLQQASAPATETIRSLELGQIRQPPAAALPLGSKLDVKPSIRPKVSPVFSLAPIHEKKEAVGHVTVEEIHVPSQPARPSTSDAIVCSVCLGEAQSEDTVRITPWFHGFHDDCLAEWLTSYQNRCPLCQRCLKPGRPV